MFELTRNISDPILENFQSSIIAVFKYEYSRKISHLTDPSGNLNKTFVGRYFSNIRFVCYIFMGPPTY